MSATINPASFVLDGILESLWKSTDSQMTVTSATQICTNARRRILVCVLGEVLGADDVTITETTCCSIEELILISWQPLDS